MLQEFSYSPAPEVLQWLSAGKLASRLHRSIRLWVILTCLYSSEVNWAADLPDPFNYSSIRDRLFSPKHPTSDRLSTEQIEENCNDRQCICHRSVVELLETDLASHQIKEWQQQVRQLTAWSSTELEQQLKRLPFLTVHRTIRDDLKHLAKMGWLSKVNDGSYRCCPASAWPRPPHATLSGIPSESVGTQSQSLNDLSEVQKQQLLQELELISFIQPDLEKTIQLLRLTMNAQESVIKAPADRQKRIFVHPDYTLAEKTQAQVEIYQQQLEELWAKPDSGVIQFESWLPRADRRIKLIVYPVCLHYVRRAKYLSAYGVDPYGQFGWHNYRLDRIISDRLGVLAWDHPDVPSDLHQLWQQKQLPTSKTIETELSKAWGFNFYFPRSLLIMRFGNWFARWYVNDMEQHPTFKLVPYKALQKLIQQHTPSEDQAELLKIVQRQSPKDFYYQAWIREGDTNVLMRLRDWRSNGEVIAPLSMREMMRQEALKELSYYQATQTET